MRRSFVRLTASPLAALTLASLAPPTFAAPTTAPVAPAASAVPTTPASAPPPAEATTAAPAVDGKADGKEEALRLFRHGIELMQEEAWDNALGEFLQSFAIYPTKNARKNAATCLTQLERYDEALALDEALIQDYGPQLSEEDRAATLRAIESLKGKTAFIVIKANVDGATIVVNKKVRGKTPLTTPILVKSGTVQVTVTKDGFGSFDDTQTIAARQTKTFDATLVQLAASGHLQVLETERRKGKVVIDGVPVGELGESGFEGTVSPGTHTLTLQGEGTLGTQPARIVVVADQTASLRLSMEELKAEVRIEPDPVTSEVLIDGVPVGRGLWEGRLRAGKHLIDVKADGYFGASKPLDAADGKKTVFKVPLERDELSPFWAHGRTFPILLTAFGGLMAGSSFNGDYENSCGEAGYTCTNRSKPFGFIAGARGSFELPNGLGFELSVGYLRLNMSVSRDLTLYSDGGVPIPGHTDDSVLFNGFFAAIGGSYAFIQKPVRLSFAIDAGVLVTHTLETRNGWVDVDASAYSPHPSCSTCTPPVQATTYTGGYKQGTLQTVDPDPITSVIPFLMPEIRFALPIGDRLRVGIGVGALIGIASSIAPAFDANHLQTVAGGGNYDPPNTPATSTTQNVVGAVKALPGPSAQESAIGFLFLPEANLNLSVSF